MCDGCKFPSLTQGMPEFCAYEGRPCVDMKLSCVLDCVQYSFPHMKMECSHTLHKKCRNLKFWVSFAWTK